MTLITSMPPHPLSPSPSRPPPSPPTSRPGAPCRRASPPPRCPPHSAPPPRCPSTCAHTLPASPRVPLRPRALLPLQLRRGLAPRTRHRPPQQPRNTPARTHRAQRWGVRPMRIQVKIRWIQRGGSLTWIRIRIWTQAAVRRAPGRGREPAAASSCLRLPAAAMTWRR